MLGVSSLGPSWRCLTARHCLKTLPPTQPGPGLSLNRHPAALRPGLWPRQCRQAAEVEAWRVDLAHGWSLSVTVFLCCFLVSYQHFFKTGGFTFKKKSRTLSSLERSRNTACDSHKYGTRPPPQSRLARPQARSQAHQSSSHFNLQLMAWPTWQPWVSSFSLPGTWSPGQTPG